MSITKPHLLVVPLSMPRSHYLTVLLQELSSKCLSTGLRIDPFPRGRLEMLFFPLDMNVKKFVLQQCTLGGHCFH